MIKRKLNGLKNYLENEDFFHFVAQEFKDVSRHATLEELAEFSFGSVQKAVKAFKEKTRV